MKRRSSLIGVAAFAVGVGVVAPLAAQNADELTIIDSVVVEGADRVGQPFVESRPSRMSKDVSPTRG